MGHNFHITNIPFWRIICRMLQPQYTDPPQLSESQVYEDLSQIIKSFKVILTSMENISSSLYKYDLISNFIDQLKEAARNLQTYMKIYSYPIDQHFEHKNTFHRFICRLIQSVSAYKLKLQNLPYYNILAQDIVEIENVIISYQRDKNIGLVIKKIQTVVNRFCLKTIKKSESYTKVTQKVQQITLQQKSSQFPSLTNEYQNQEKMIGFSIGINQIKPKKVIESKSQNSLNKVMNLLNRRYKTFSCLDIDYQQYKYLFFRSRDTKDELFEDCVERNSFIHREILRYSKQFSEYLQRRELKIFRKNKFVDSLAHPPNLNNKVKNKLHNKLDEHQETSYNFMRKKMPHDSRKAPNINHIQSNTSYVDSPSLMIRSQMIDDKFSNLVSIQHLESRNLTPQLIENSKRGNVLPFMIKGHDHHFDEKQRFEEIAGETFMELSRRKKNLQLKKIDISLTSFTNGGQTQSAKTKNKLLNSEAFKKTPVHTSKQMEQKINASIRKNYIQKKYDQAMKKNMDESLIDFGQIQKSQYENPSKYSSTKRIEVEDEDSPSQIGRQRKCLFKTTNKRPLNTGNQFKSLNPVNQRREISAIKNFRRLKMDQVEKVQKLQKMKEKALNHMELCSGGRAIRPAFIYRSRQLTQNIYTQAVQNDFTDLNLGSHKQLQIGQRFHAIEM